MAITSRSNKPNEWASKINHTHIINDPVIKDFISKCDFPKSAEEISDEDKDLIYELNSVDVSNPIKHLVAVDGGYTVVEVKKNYPSSQVAFFQFGALLFKIEDLEALSDKPFIFPEDINQLHNLQRFKLALPIKNLKFKKEHSLGNSVRKSIYDFFMKQRDSANFMETLYWFIFEDYKKIPKDSYILGSNPNVPDSHTEVVLKRNEINSDFTYDTNDGVVYLTDVFRLHEAVDEEQGASGILGYVTRLIEQLILVHYIKYIYKNNKSLLNEFMFIADGPLSFSGQTANMHKPMRELCNYLKHEANLYLVGVEKSGPFVDHAHEICIPKKGLSILNIDHYIILSNEYIYKYIVPGDSERMHYGSTSYYGGKVIFHSYDGQILVVTVPIDTKDAMIKPDKLVYLNIEKILVNIEKLRCDMYDDSIIPIALANKLVSLANHPSKVILEKFATKNLKKEC